MRILLVEDDRELAAYIGKSLEEEGNTVTLAYDGEAGLRSAASSKFDAIVLDVMLPQVDGFEVTRRLRSKSVATPILLLTARDAPRDIVKGLDAGADDYLAKPFVFEVLLARLRARTRPGASPASVLRWGDVAVDPGTLEAWRADQPLHLTRTEFGLLECLIRSSGRVVTRQRLIESVWGSDRDVGSNNLDVFIRFLRSKVDRPERPRLIQTVRGIGYCLREEPR